MGLKFKNFFLIFLFCKLDSAKAIEHFFNLSDVTAKGKLTSFPAGLGWIEPGISFSAAANSLELKYYDSSNGYSTYAEPLAIKPTLIASALGQSWGGWSMVVTNQSQDLRTQRQMLNSSTTQSNLKTNLIGLKLGTGLRISDNWSLGWNLNFNQYSSEGSDVISEQGNTEKSLTSVYRLEKAFLVNLAMGFMGDWKAFTFGLQFQSPGLEIRNQGMRESTQLVTSQTDTKYQKEDYKLAIKKVASLEFGIRFGKQGFVYSVNDQYQFNGSHEVKLGFDYKSTWGSVTSGFSYLDFDKNIKNKWLVGYARSKGNFSWVVGPFYERDNSTKDTVGSKNYGVLYASQINY